MSPDIARNAPPHPMPYCNARIALPHHTEHPLHREHCDIATLPDRFPRKPTPTQATQVLATCYSILPGLVLCVYFLESSSNVVPRAISPAMAQRQALKRGSPGAEDEILGNLERLCDLGQGVMGAALFVTFPHNPQAPLLKYYVSQHFLSGLELSQGLSADTPEFTSVLQALLRGVALRHLRCLEGLDDVLRQAAYSGGPSCSRSVASANEARCSRQQQHKLEALLDQRMGGLAGFVSVVRVQNTGTERLVGGGTTGWACCTDQEWHSAVERWVRCKGRHPGVRLAAGVCLWRAHLHALCNPLLRAQTWRAGRDGEAWGGDGRGAL